jgi:hypothetical protein
MLNEIKSLNIFNRIKFFDHNHTYHIDGKITPKSITSVISGCKPKFDSDKWSKHTAKKLNVDQSVVLKEWKENSEFSTQLGTLLHSYIENYLCNKIKKYDQSLIIEKFGTEKHNDMRGILAKFIKSFHGLYEKLDHLIPLKSELIVGDVDDTRICGTIDLLAYNTKKQCYEIYDYKTNKKFTYKNDYKEKFLHPELSHLDSCDLTSYSLQQSLYKFLIEKYTSIKIQDCFIVWFNRADGSCELIKCLDLTKHCENILKSSI